MKVNPFNTIVKLLFRFINRKPVHFTKDLQHHKETGREGKLLRYVLKKPCELNALGSPAEEITSAFVACDAGDPTMLNELVKKGYVVGSIESAREIFHKIFLRELPVFAKPILAREECHNEEISREEECHNVDEANALDADEDGWFKVSPYGEYPGKTPGRIQYFGLPEAQAMESHFNSVAGRLGRLFRGCPIFIGHPDVDRSIWPDERRLGKVSGLQARADGLWARGEWNSLGADNKENGYWVYPSPRWDGA